MKLRAIALVMALVFPLPAFGQRSTSPPPGPTAAPGESIPAPQVTPSTTKAPRKKATKKGKAKTRRARTPVPTPAAK